MSDRTGYALGNLSPILYFERADGFIVLAAYDKGKPEQARQVYEAKFKPQGYEWRETRNLQDVDALQRKLVEQELREANRRDAQDDYYKQECFRRTGSNLRQWMQSDSCTPYERDFIKLYLELRETKRDKYRQRWSEAQSYLWIREMGSKSKVEDRMKGDLSL